jgi:hypothetical protein
VLLQALSRPLLPNSRIDKWFNVQLADSSGVDSDQAFIDRLVVASDDTRETPRAERKSNA